MMVDCSYPIEGDAWIMGSSRPRRCEVGVSGLKSDYWSRIRKGGSNDSVCKAEQRRGRGLVLLEEGVCEFEPRPMWQ